MNELIISANNIEAFLKAGNSEFIKAKVIVSGFSLKQLATHKKALYCLLYYSDSIEFKGCEKGILGVLIGVGLPASISIVETNSIGKAPRHSQLPKPAEVFIHNNHKATQGSHLATESLSLASPSPSQKHSASVSNRGSSAKPATLVRGP